MQLQLSEATKGLTTDQHRTRTHLKPKHIQSQQKAKHEPSYHTVVS